MGTKKRKRQVANELIAMLDKGYHMGKITIKSRDEIYERSRK